MTAPSDWERWEQRWRGAATPATEVEALLARTRRTRRAIGLVRVLSVMLTLVALGAVGGALAHAGNLFEKSLGVIVGAGIVGVWLLGAANQRHAMDSVDAPADSYRDARIALCQRQIRFSQLGWAVVALELIFLIPWWIGGIAVHGGGFHAMQVLTTWLPLASMAGFVGWAARLRRRARAELARLASGVSSE